MRKSRKLKEKPPTFYICNQHGACAGSSICGKECKHTADIANAKYGTHPKFKRKNDGSQWEVEHE